MSAENEVRAIVSRLDITTLISTLVQYEKLSEFAINFRPKCALEMPKNTNFKKVLHCSCTCSIENRNINYGRQFEIKKMIDDSNFSRIYPITSTIKRSLMMVINF